MLVHLISSTTLRRMLVDTELEAKLFGTPNRILGTPDLARLLRVRYFIPWTALPQGASVLDSRTRAVLVVSRLSGFAFILCVAAFFLTMFAQVAQGA